MRDLTSPQQVINYDDPAQFAAERDYIREVFSPLVEKCKSLNRAMRIGTNHGSLSARILSYYGDTPRCYFFSIDPAYLCCCCCFSVVVLMSLYWCCWSMLQSDACASFEANVTTINV